MAVIHDKDPWGEPEAPRRGYRWLWLLLVLGMAVGVGGYIWRYTFEFEKVTVVSPRLTLTEGGEENLTVIDRETGPEVWFHVILRDTPINAVLPLTCEWIDPSGNVYHRNDYSTKTITRPDWPTHARCRIFPDAPSGRWHVRLVLRGRLLHQQGFVVWHKILDSKWGPSL